MNAHDKLINKLTRIVETTLHITVVDGDLEAATDIDSLDRIDLQMALEDNFQGLSIEPDAMTNVQSIQDLATLLMSGANEWTLLCSPPHAELRVGLYFHASVGLHHFVEFDNGTTNAKGYLDTGMPASKAPQNDVLLTSGHDAYVWICNRTINYGGELVSVMEAMCKAKASLLIIARGFSGEVAATVAANRSRGAVHAVITRLPGGPVVYDQHASTLARLVGCKRINTMQPPLEDLGKVAYFNSLDQGTRLFFKD